MGFWIRSGRWEVTGMTMSRITAKLRKKNRDQYLLLGICIFLSGIMVTSFTMMYFSPSIQELLPPGGDTRKLMKLMMGVVMIGCLIFTLYGSSLFFRKKSREFGVMLALGEERGALAGQLAKELAAVVVKYVLSGILLAVPVSYLIWKLFQAIALNTARLKYRPGNAGIFAGILFAAILSLCILILGIRFIRQADIMNILNASRKMEMVREIKPWFGRLGAALVAAGLFLAMAVPQLTVRLFRQGMPAIWNVTYLLGIAGLYLIVLSAVGYSKKGKHPEKYYKNIISTNLMRFTARQTTRNMLCIALLVFVMVGSAFWGVMYYFSAMDGGGEAPYDYSWHYPAKEAQIGKKETEKIAREHKVTLTAYEDLDSLQLVIRYTGRDMDEQKRYFDAEYEKLATFIAASDFERISGRSISLKAGEYQTVTTTDFQENVWVSVDCLNEIENPATGERMVPEFRGTAEFDNLAIGSDPFAFLLSDEDYNRFAKDLPDDWKEKHAFFNAEYMTDAGDKKFYEYEFADAVIREYIARATELSNHYGLYDSREEELALAAGKEYGYAGKIDLSPDNPQIMDDWKYAPFSKIFLQANAMEMVAVFVLLSIYISVISLTAAGIMSYIRSITIAMDNRQLFEDLRRLGTDDAYEEKVIKVQLRKIFAYPVAAGCTVVGLFSLFLTYFNDMRLQAFEVNMLLLEVLLMIFIAGVLYVVYRIAYGKMRRIVAFSGRRA